MIKKRFAKLAILLIFITSIASIIFLHNSIIDASSPYQLNNLKDSIFEVNINSNTVEFNDHIGYPELRKERTMVPIRVISENMGYEVGWDDQERVVRIMNADESISVEFKVGDSFALVNGKETPMDRREDGTVIDTKSYLKGERTMVPLRFIAEAFGSNVGYKRDKGVNYVTINTKSTPVEPGEPVEPVEPGKDGEWGIKRPNEKPNTGKVVNNLGGHVDGNDQYSVYPKSKTVIFDGPVSYGSLIAEKIGDEPAGWVEPKFNVVSGLEGPNGHRFAAQFSIRLGNADEYAGKETPITTAKASPEYEKLASYNIPDGNGGYIKNDNSMYYNRDTKRVFYQLTLLSKGKYDDGSPVKYLDRGTVVPVYIEYTQAGYTKNYVIPVKIK